VNGPATGGSASASAAGAGRREIYERRHLPEVAARWDARAKTWDENLTAPGCHLNEDDAYERFVQLAQSVIARRRQFCSRQGVIDAGCGTGLVLAEVVGSFAWGIGVDISPEMIRLAQAKQIRGARFILGDCFELARLCPKAGAVLSRGVLLSHYGRGQALALLAAARAVLLPGGFLLYDLLNESARGKYAHQAEEKTGFRRDEVVRLAREAGFGEVTVIGEENRRVLVLLAAKGR
jgi:SAM-dependent methyltransferase